MNKLGLSYTGIGLRTLGWDTVSDGEYRIAAAI